MDLNRMFNALNSSGVASGLAGGLAGGAISGALMNKKGRKLAGTALKVGGIAAVGGLAYKAYRNYQQGQQGQSPAGTNSTDSYPNMQQGNGFTQSGSAATNGDQWQQLSPNHFEVQTDTDQDSAGLLLIRAMIAAANADGHIDPAERERIFTQVEAQNLGAEEKAMLFDALSKPESLEDICGSVKEPAMAMEVYTVSALAVDSDSPVSGHYLQALSNRLGLPQPMVENIHNELAGLSGGMLQQRAVS